MFPPYMQQGNQYAAGQPMFPGANTGQMQPPSFSGQAAPNMLGGSPYGYGAQQQSYGMPGQMQPYMQGQSGGSNPNDQRRRDNMFNPAPGQSNWNGWGGPQPDMTPPWYNEQRPNLMNMPFWLINKRYWGQ